MKVWRKKDDLVTLRLIDTGGSKSYVTNCYCLTFECKEDNKELPLTVEELLYLLYRVKGAARINFIPAGFWLACENRYLVFNKYLKSAKPKEIAYEQGMVVLRNDNRFYLAEIISSLFTAREHLPPTTDEMWIELLNKKLIRIAL